MGGGMGVGGELHSKAGTRPGPVHWVHVLFKVCGSGDIEPQVQGPLQKERRDPRPALCTHTPCAPTHPAPKRTLHPHPVPTHPAPCI